jgi:hypothetical protein
LPLRVGFIRSTETVERTRGLCVCEVCATCAHTNILTK